MSEWLPGTWVPKGPPVVNTFPDPSFETEAFIPVGAERSSAWAASRTHSLFVPPNTGYGHGPYGQTTYGAGPE